jgi:dolichol-phosphate mannosyltransferase
MVYPITNIRDYSCGYRAYRAALLKKAIRAYGQQLFQSEGFSCMVGILLKLHKLDAICGEVPIILCYDRKEGVSKMRVSRTVWNTLRVLLRERFSGKAAVKPAS